MNTDFGKKLKEIREANRWSLEEMADKIGTTKQALSRYERGERVPKITVVANIAEKLHVPMEEFLPKHWLSFTIPPKLNMADSDIMKALEYRAEGRQLMAYDSVPVQSPALAPEDEELLRLWTNATPTAKQAALAVLKAMEGVK